MRVEFPFNLTSKLTIAFLTGQSWRVLKSWYTAGGPEQGFRRCFADGLKKKRLISVWAQATFNPAFQVLSVACLCCQWTAEPHFFFYPSVLHPPPPQPSSSIIRILCDFFFHS